MADFQKFVPLLLKVEAKTPPNHSKMTNDQLLEYAKRYGYVVDSGGPTQCGVTLKAYRAVFGNDKSVDDLKNINYFEWYTIMKVNHWDMVKADKIANQSCAEIIADWVINSGTAVIKKVQDIVGADTDGIVGLKTLSAINAMPPKCLHCRIKEAREKYFRRLAQLPSNAKYLDGWLMRLSYFIYQP